MTDHLLGDTSGISGTIAERGTEMKLSPLDYDGSPFWCIDYSACDLSCEECTEDNQVRSDPSPLHFTLTLILSIAVFLVFDIGV